MVKWKLQAIEPDTCSGGQCRYLEWWDADTDPLTRTHTIAAFERVCTAHADPDILAHIASGLMLGFDGNWKQRAAYIEYQRAWFRHLNFVEWNRPTAMPESIRGYGTEPQTPGSVAAPPQAHQDALARVGALNRQHNVWKNQSIDAIAAQLPQLDRQRLTWNWTGIGANRVLHITSDGQVAGQQRTRSQAAADIAFGTGKVIIEG